MKLGVPIVSSLCIFIIIIMMIQLVREFEKQQEMFMITQLNQYQKTNFDSNAKNCLELATSLGSSQVSALSDSQKNTLAAFKNNTYTTGDGREYGTNQCIIPSQDLGTNKIRSDCSLENSTIQLEENRMVLIDETKNSPPLNWKIPQGCVINENMIRNDLQSIVTKIEANKLSDMKNANDKLSGNIEGNYNQAKALDVTTQEYQDTASKNNYYEGVAGQQTELEIVKASAEQQKGISLLNKATEFNVDASEADAFNDFLNNKIIGIRWYAFEDYFEPDYNNKDKTNTFLDNIWSGKTIPYDSGIVQTINNYEGMTDPTGKYKHFGLTQGVTYVYEFEFKPDETGYWEFEIGSDDASYVWMWNDSLSWIRPTTNSLFGNCSNPMRITNINESSYALFIDNGNYHGMQYRRGKTRVELVSGRLYKMYIVQGNHGTPGTSSSGNYQGCILNVCRPNNTQFFRLRNGDVGIGARNTRWANKYLAFDYLKRGMLAKVYAGYFGIPGAGAQSTSSDSLDFFRNKQPLAAVRLREAYNMGLRQVNWITDNGRINQGHGFTKTGDFNINNPELVRSYGNHTNPTYEKLYKYDQYQWIPNGEGRTISLFGYFRAPVTSKYKFYLSGDDATYLWFGGRSKEKVISGLNDAFDTLKGGDRGSGIVQSLPGPHAPQSQPIIIDLEAGSAVPVRVVQGDQGGWGTLMFGYEIMATGENVYDLTRDFVF